MSTRVPLPARAVAAAVGLVLALLVAGCTQVVPGRAAAPAPAAPALPAPRANVSPLPLTTDELSATATTALQDMWRELFPAAFGRDWTDIDSFVPVRTASGGAPAPPCLDRAADLAGQAFYCPARDTVAWDADGLLPGLRDRFGAAGVVVVLAHEVGHAVQNRLGVDEALARDPARYPTILLEAMADCYAGVALARLVDRPVEGLPIGLVERDDALLALVGFRDPAGVAAGDDGAHGNAFDRVSAFQDGYTGGATRCAGMTLDSQRFTQRRFASAEDLARGGDLELPALIDAVESDAQTWFTQVVAPRVPGWRAPAVGRSPSCPGREGLAQGPAAFCAADGGVSVSPGELAAVHRQFGDYAAAELVASRYGLAARQAVGGGVTGTAAGAAAICLSGAYTSRLIDGDGFALSPGDLDEAVQVLLAGDWAARDAAGAVDPGEHGFDRVGRFRAGVLDGPDRCLTMR